ncbi:MAG: hypothetical protein PWQ64_621 [Desulfomicrobiaceae bacterium]|nr:hypothetical protein [Desulfomicrobiaceae bacterium]
MPVRPHRVKIRDELGRSQSLADGPQCFAWEGAGTAVLVLGAGPAPHATQRLIGEAAPVFLLEAPGLARQMPDPWHAAIPAAWQRIRPQDLARLPACRHLSYLPGLRLFPSFWQPVLARLRRFSCAPPADTIWLPGPDNGLVRHELATAAHALGLAPRLLPAEISAPRLLALLGAERPRLVLSINFHGLDPWGENQAILQTAQVPVVVWCVDNPFHLLAKVKTRAWRNLPLAVTDPWFVRPLREMGGRPFFLPLATCPRIFAPRAAPPSLAALFVGRTRFPGSEAFFAAAHPPAALCQRARRLARWSRAPDLSWWWERCSRPRPWPGHAIRAVGHGADEASRQWRASVLTALAQALPLTVVGDAAWQELLPHAHILPPVDYYGPLADTYAQAAVTLNLTSLLLPQGLTQRHFDVWACGGFLLSDATPGLRLFPRELTAPVTFATPDQAVCRTQYFLKHECERRDLAAAWQAHILAHHTYTQRLAALLEATTHP